MTRAMASTITIKASCHCKNASYTYTLPTSAFPLKSALCHCRSCRHVTGQPFITLAVIPSSERPDVSNLTAYATSSTITRYFCPTCGASVANFEDEWEFASGVLEVEGRSPEGGLEGILNRVQLFVGDTGDGGAAVWLSGDWKDRRWRRHRGQEAVTDDMLSEMQAQHAQPLSGAPDEELKAHCHCGRIRITIQRPDHGGKYAAILDSCTSCRKVSGFEITSWADLDPAKVSINDRGLNLTDPDLGSYSTSPGVDRYFCKHCGAKVFYHRPQKEGKPEIDLAVGLIDSAVGARAEDWLEWEKGDEFVVYKEDASDASFVASLVNGKK